MMPQHKHAPSLKQTTLLLLFFTLSFLITSCADEADDDYTPATFTIEGDEAIMSGVIDASTIDEVEFLLDENPDVTTIVMLEVDGSADDEANLIAARLIRDAGLHTHVPADGLIASGGVDFFLAGIERTVEDGAQLGVHSWGSDDADGDELGRNDPQHTPYLNYYAEMGIPANFYWFTLDAAPADDMYFMTLDEILDYELITE